MSPRGAPSRVDAPTSPRPPPPGLLLVEAGQLGSTHTHSTVHHSPWLTHLSHPPRLSVSPPSSLDASLRVHTRLTLQRPQPPCRAHAQPAQHPPRPQTRPQNAPNPPRPPRSATPPKTRCPRSSPSATRAATTTPTQTRTIATPRCATSTAMTARRRPSAQRSTRSRASSARATVRPFFSPRGRVLPLTCTLHTLSGASWPC